MAGGASSRTVQSTGFYIAEECKSDFGYASPVDQ